MKIQEAISGSQDAVTVRRVFGKPVERDGVTVIPAAAVIGGAGGGGGSNNEHGEGGGTGFGLLARPAGAYIIRDGGDVRWSPTIDVTGIILRGQVIAAIVFVLLRLLRRP
jgi:uncharacterized spore protein YtfJ